MEAEFLARLERLAAAGVSILPLVELDRHFVFTRGSVAVLVERRGEGFGGIGSPGRITANGFEPLVDDGGAACFVFKGHRQEASAAEAAEAKKLLADLKSALA